MEIWTSYEKDGTTYYRIRNISPEMEEINELFKRKLEDELIPLISNNDKARALYLDEDEKPNEDFPIILVFYPTTNRYHIRFDLSSIESEEQLESNLLKIIKSTQAQIVTMWIKAQEM